MEWTELDKLTGSRNSDGNVSNVNWNNDKLKVNWNNPDNSNDNLRAREVVSSQRNPAYAGFLKYFIQPFVILEISCKSDSNSMYFLSPIIFNSLVVLTSRFRTSILILAEFNIGNLLFLISNDAAKTSRKASRQSFSIFDQIPNRSRLEISKPKR